jgi:hypothetical protein
MSTVKTIKMPGILYLKEVLLPTLEGVYHLLGLGENIPIVTGTSSDSLQALQVAEKLLRFVGRAFRHDIKVAFSSGVLTPEDRNPLFSAN